MGHLPKDLMGWKLSSIWRRRSLEARRMVERRSKSMLPLIWGRLRFWKLKLWSRSHSEVECRVSLESISSTRRFSSWIWAHSPKFLKTSSSTGISSSGSSSPSCLTSGWHHTCTTSSTQKHLKDQSTNSHLDLSQWWQQRPTRSTPKSSGNQFSANSLQNLEYQEKTNKESLIHLGHKTKSIRSRTISNPRRSKPRKMSLWHTKTKSRGPWSWRRREDRRDARQETRTTITKTKKEIQSRRRSQR